MNGWMVGSIDRSIDRFSECIRQCDGWPGRAGSRKQSRVGRTSSHCCHQNSSSKSSMLSRSNNNNNNNKSKQPRRDNQEAPRVKRRTAATSREQDETGQNQEAPSVIGRATERERGPLLVGLTWPTRLTIILVGASLLFSVFFGLEFLVAKLVASLESGELPERASSRLEPTVVLPVPNDAQQVGRRAQFRVPQPQTFIDALSWPVERDQPLGPQSPTGEHQWWSRLSEQYTPKLDAPAQTSSLAGSEIPSEFQYQAGTDRSQCVPNKLGVNFELIYESQLELEPDGRHFRVPDGVETPHLTQDLLVQPELKLRQLLEAHHVSMPFDPDIWTLSEPREQARNLLSGHLHECRAQLGLLVKSIERALSMGPGASHGHSRPTTNGSAEPPPAPLSRIGHEHYQLMRLLDAQGRPEAATLTGHPYWLGSYLECRQFQSRQAGRRHKSLVVDTRGRPLETRYCVGKLAFKSWLARENPPKVPSIKVGVCVPRACDSLELFRHAPRNAGEHLSGRHDAIEDVRQLVEKLIAFNMNEKIYPSGQMKLLDVYCLPQRRQLSAGAFLLLLAALIWLSFLALCTLERWRRIKSRASGGSQDDQARLLSSASDHLLHCMAIDVNFQLFFSPKKTSNLLRCPLSTPVEAKGEQMPLKNTQHVTRGVVNLNVLDSFKHLGCAGVIGAHVLLTYLTLGSSFMHTIETMGGDMRTMLLLSLNNIVDTFFAISGLLVAYLTFRKLKDRRAKSATEWASQSDGKKKRRQIWLRGYLYIVASRYLRMAPVYFLVYAFAKFLSVHMGEGPLWDYATNSESIRGLCARESWFWALGFASDFKPLTQHCVPPAWSISVDMQFFLVVPFFVRALAWVARSKSRARKLASYILLGALIATSSLLTLIDYKSLLDYVSERDFAKLRLQVFTVLIRYAPHAYSQPQNRMGPILIGMISGHLLFEYEQQEVENRRSRQSSEPFKALAWPWWMRGKYFRLALCACAAFMVAPCLVQARERARVWVAVASGGPESAGSFVALKKLVELMLFLWTSDLFDCRLALGGLVLIKPLWSVANCLIFLRLITDLNGSLWARFMSLPIWQILSKLNYTVLLIHFELIAYEAMSRLNHEQVAITWSCLLAKFAYAYLFSLCLAVGLYVLFEQPLHRLTQSLFAWPSARSNDRDENHNQSAQVGINHTKQVAASSVLLTSGGERPSGDLRQQLEDMQEESRVRRLAR